MKNASPSGAPLWMASWQVISIIILLNMFIAILINAYMSVSSRVWNQDKAEGMFEMPSWGLYLRSKFACCCTDPDVRETVVAMVTEQEAWRTHLSLVSKERLWLMMLQRVGQGIFDFEVRDAMALFPGYDEYASYQKAVTWMRGLSEATGLAMRKCEEEASTEWEIGVLVEHVGKMEEEIIGLISQLQQVAPKAKQALFEPI